MLLNEAIDKHISWHNSLALLFDTQKFEIHLSYEYIMPHNKLTFIYSCFGNLFLRKCLEPSEFHTFWYNDQRWSVYFHKFPRLGNLLQVLIRKRTDREILFFNLFPLFKVISLFHIIFYFDGFDMRQREINFLIKSDISNVDTTFFAHYLSHAYFYFFILVCNFVALFAENMIFKILTDATVLGFYFPQFTGEAQILVTFQASEKIEK